MAAPNPKAFTAIYLLIGLLGVGCAAAICGIVDDKFWTFVGGYWGWSYGVVQDDCALGWTGTPNDSTNLCYFNWTTASIGGFIMLVAWFMALCSRGRGKATGYIIIFFLSLICWAVAGGVNSANLPDANAESDRVQEETGVDDGLTDWRNAILGLSWTAFGLSCLGLLAAAMDMKNNKTGVQQQPQFYAAGGGPPPGAYQPPPGAYPPPAGAYPPSDGAMGGAAGYPPVGPPPTFYPVPGAAGGAPAPIAGWYQPPPAGYPPPAQY